RGAGGGRRCRKPMGVHADRRSHPGGRRHGIAAQPARDLLVGGSTPMNRSRQSSRRTRVRPLLMGCLAATGLAGAGVGAQRNSVHPQPRAETLPAPSKATANQNKRAPQPEGTLPKVSAGFSVASYAELRGPRMMVYAPNGDLFVS